VSAPVAVTARHELPGSWPVVSVVIATVDRPALLRRAVSAAIEQEYDGPVEVVVVHDRTAPRDVGVPVEGVGRSVRVVANARTPGLAGARNTGIVTSEGTLVAFCDDDDAWAPTKLREQVRLWRDHPDAAAVATGMVIRTGADEIERLPPLRTTFADLLRSRVLGLHPSALLLRREDLLGEVGLVDEQLPRSYGEDYDLLLRLTRHGDILTVPQPLLRVDWARPSYFDGAWDAVSGGMTYLLGKFPELRTDRRGWARIAGQIAFAHAASGRRSAAARWACAVLVRDPVQLRGYAALAVAAGLVSPRWLLEQMHRRGHGL
jgi:glycosyltransferase involved in cell wall biosynthesis